jgi:hypothetical protein
MYNNYYYNKQAGRKTRKELRLCRDVSLKNRDLSNRLRVIVFILSELPALINLLSSEPMWISFDKNGKKYKFTWT